MTGAIKITNIPASARALGADSSVGGVIHELEKEGLTITNTSIEFPEHLLNSITWVVGWKWEVLYYEDREWQTKQEINEMKALKRLLDRLKKMGGIEALEYGEEP